LGQVAALFAIEAGSPIGTMQAGAAAAGAGAGLGSAAALAGGFAVVEAPSAVVGAMGSSVRLQPEIEACETRHSAASDVTDKGRLQFIPPF
jgi:hypothetical protein